METETSQVVRIVLVTFPDLDTARQIGTHLVESQLIACINLLPGIESIYRWKGTVETAGEVLGILKTTDCALKALEAAILEKHPYEMPEFLVVKPDGGLAGYLEWVAETCSKND